MTMRGTLTVSPRLKYFLWAATHMLKAERSCPACGSQQGVLIKRKNLVTALVECQSCSLRFRTPKDDQSITSDFYTEERYKQGFTTDLPTDAELAELLSIQFAGTEKHFAYRRRVFEVCGLRRGAKVLDFGSSWGYASWQMRQAGYDVYSYEIGRERARYAEEKLHCNVVSELTTVAGQMDAFFSADVIEHLPNPNLFFEEATKALRPGGLLICFCPNGAVERQRAQPKEYHRHWGMVHPNLATPAYVSKQAHAAGYDVEMVRSDAWVWGNSGEDPHTVKDDLLGEELLIVARKR